MLFLVVFILNNVIKKWVVTLFVLKLVVFFALMVVFVVVVLSLASCCFNVASRFFWRWSYSLIWWV